MQDDKADDPRVIELRNYGESSGFAGWHSPNTPCSSCTLSPPVCCEGQQGSKRHRESQQGWKTSQVASFGHQVWYASQKAISWVKSLKFPSCLCFWPISFPVTPLQKNLQEAALGLKEKAQGVSFEAMLMTQIGLELFGRFEEEKERHIQKTQKEIPLWLGDELKRQKYIVELDLTCKTLHSPQANPSCLIIDRFLKVVLSIKIFARFLIQASRRLMQASIN